MILMQSKLLLSDSCAIHLWTFLSACLKSASKQQWEQQNCFKQMTHVKAKLCANKKVLKAHTQASKEQVQLASELSWNAAFYKSFHLPPLAVTKIVKHLSTFHRAYSTLGWSDWPLSCQDTPTCPVTKRNAKSAGSPGFQRTVPSAARWNLQSPVIGNMLKPPPTPAGLGNLYIYIYPRKQISRSCATNSLLWSKHQTQRNLAIVYSFPLVDPDVAASRRTPPWKIERLPAKDAKQRIKNAKWHF